MKFTISLWALLAVVTAFGQQPLIDRVGVASFFSEAPIENITAENKQVMGALNPQSGSVAVSMLITGFVFDKSLMQEHFNENYMESEKYPKATFTGVIKNYSAAWLTKAGTYEAQAEGEITIHGVTRPLAAPVTFRVATGTMEASTVFVVRLADFNIKIPKIVISNIAEEVEVKSRFQFILPQ